MNTKLLLNRINTWFHCLKLLDRRFVLNKTANVGLNISRAVNLNSIGAKFKDVWWSNVPERNVTVLIKESGDKKTFTCSQGKTLC